MSDRPVVIVSNRGPLSFHIDANGEPVAGRGAGGLVSGLGPLVAGTDAQWIAAAISPADRLAATQGMVEAEGFRVHSLALDPEDYRQAYDVVCNAGLWFMHHQLWDLARRPRFDRRWAEAWAAYRRVNHAFAAVVADEAPDGAVVLVQDYHLTLLAPVLRLERPDLRLVHFSHTPFAGPDQLRVLPNDVSTELLSGMAEHHACCFHAQRWADGWIDSCRVLLGEDYRDRAFVSPLEADPHDIGRVAATPACAARLTEIDRLIGDRSFLVRVDRIELSKNLLRGFHAYDVLLERYPEWRDRVVFGAYCYPSREGLPEYLAYRQEVDSLVQAINARWGTPDWTPILFDASDDFPGSVAALRRYDVLLVNPVRDGLNLVAKEGALVNEHHGLVALSTEAGAFDALEGAVRAINPFDVSGTADVLAAALGAGETERIAESDELRRRVTARTPADWLADQLEAVG
jgi:trehalose 6-phosphate synthase